MTSYLYPYLQESASISENSKDNYILTIQQLLDGLSFVIFDTKEQKFICLKHYNISEKDIPLETLLIELQARENWKLNDFKTVNFVIDNNENTFIPEDCYQEECTESYFKFLFKRTIHYSNTDRFSTLGAVNIYPMQENVSAILSQFCKKTNIYHTSTILIDSLIKEFSERNQEIRAFINVKKNVYELVVINNSDLIFHNYFNYNTKEDFIYFLLFTFEQLKVDNEAVPLYFMGFVEEKSPVVELCSRYIRNIRFFNRNNNLNYSNELDSIPYYYYYTLYNSILCE